MQKRVHDRELFGRMTGTREASCSQNLREPGYGYQARATKEHPVKVTQECTDRGETFTRQEVVSPAGGLWLHTDIGERLLPRQAPERRPHGAVGVRHENLDVEPCAAPIAAASGSPRRWSSTRAGRRSGAAPR